MYNDDAVQVLRVFGIGCVSATVSTEIGDLMELYIEKKKPDEKVIDSVSPSKAQEADSPSPQEEEESNNGAIKPHEESLRAISPIDSNDITGDKVKKGIVRRFANAAIEGGVLFATFHVIVGLLHQVVPDNYNSKFLFDQVIETLEEDLASF
jgi:hypothetical protein